MVCDFDDASSANTATTDSQRDFTSISMFGSKYFPILYYTYNSQLVMEFSICKIGDKNNKNLISPTECAVIKRWLGSPNASELRLCSDEYDGYFWNGTFNIEEIHYAFGCIGFHLTFTATAPFGYKDKLNFSGSVDKDGSISINDTSDEEGYLYTDITLMSTINGQLLCVVVHLVKLLLSLIFCKLCQVIILMSWVMILIISLYELTMSMAKQLIN